MTARLLRLVHRGRAVVCRDCGLRGPRLGCSAEAAQLATVHDQLLHGGKPTARVAVAA